MRLKLFNESHAGLDTHKFPKNKNTMLGMHCEDKVDTLLVVVLLRRR